MKAPCPTRVYILRRDAGIAPYAEVPPAAAIGNNPPVSPAASQPPLHKGALRSARGNNPRIVPFGMQYDFCGAMREPCPHRLANFQKAW